MKVYTSETLDSATNTHRMIFRVEPDKYDLELGSTLKRGTINLKEVDIDLVEGGRLAHIHPDLIGLVALLLIAPMSKKVIQLDRPVSDDFARIASEHLIQIIAPSAGISRRKTNPKFKPALAFSGGVDSCAALTLMPENTVPVFLHRRRPPNALKGNYVDRAALASCTAVKNFGYDMQQVPTSMEYIRKPVGNPIDWSNAAPAIINADTLQLNSIAYGMIAESAYWTGGPYFSDLKQRNSYFSWAPIFEYCNIPFSFPTAGLSEVVTSKICLAAKKNFLPQSCVRGEPGRPCKSCFKCFRKALVEAALNRQMVAPDILDKSLHNTEVPNKLLEDPIHHQIVLAWALNKTPRQKHLLLDLPRHKLRKVMSYGDELGFLERHYLKSIEYVPAPDRGTILRNIEKYCTPMTPKDENLFCKWKADDFAVPLR